MINYSIFFSFPEATLISVIIAVPTTRCRIKSPLLHLTKIKTYLKFVLRYEKVALCTLILITVVIHILKQCSTYFVFTYSLFDIQKKPTVTEYNSNSKSTFSEQVLQRFTKNEMRRTKALYKQYPLRLDYKVERIKDL